MRPTRLSSSLRRGANGDLTSAHSFLRAPCRNGGRRLMQETETMVATTLTTGSQAFS